MREPVFTGACTAIVTPFDQSGAIDYGCFGRLIDQQLDHGVDAICVCGTTGESATPLYPGAHRRRGLLRQAG